MTSHERYQDIKDLLYSLNLEKYIDFFIQEEIDMDTLLTTFERPEELAHIGITKIGPQRKIWNSLKRFRGSSYSQFQQEVILTYPYPVAKLFHTYLQEDEPRAKIQFLIETFTNIIKMWALQILSEYFFAENIKDSRINKLLKKDVKKPFISVWNIILDECISALEDSKIDFFCPEMVESWKRLEKHCQDKISINVRYEDIHGNRRIKTKKLPKITSIIHYRNSLAHGFNQPRNKAQADLEFYAPILDDILHHSTFMQRYQLFYIPDQQSMNNASRIQGYRLKGYKPSSEIEELSRVDFDLQLSPLFMRDDKGRSLPLFIFFDVGDVDEQYETLPSFAKDLFIFDGNTGRSVIYYSCSGCRYEKESRFQHWKKLLQKKELDVVRFHLDSLNVDSLRSVSQNITEETLDKLFESGKYIPELNVRRPDLDKELAQFDFGDFRGFVLGGESGIGKTYLMASYAREYADSGDIVLFFRASSLTQGGFDQYILRRIGLGNIYFEDFLQKIDSLVSKGETHSPRVRVLLDAVNEFPYEIEDIIRTIDDMVQQAADYPWFRLIVSIRSSVFERLSAQQRFGEKEGTKYYWTEEQRGLATQQTYLINLKPLGFEHLERMYEGYRNFQKIDPADPAGRGKYLFRPRTTFQELQVHGSTCAMMRNPLMMRIMLSAYHWRELPSDLSYDHIMQLFMDHVVIDKNEPGGGFPRRRFFLTSLVKQMDKVESDALPWHLAVQDEDLKKDLHNYQKDSPYVQLLDLGVLIEEWDENHNLIRFTSDRFFEFLLAELLYPRIERASDFFYEVQRVQRFKGVQGALQIVLLKACRDGRYELVAETLDECDLDAEEDAAEKTKIVLEVVGELLVQIAKNRDPAFSNIIKQLPLQPNSTDVRLLIRVFDDLFLLGEMVHAEEVIDTAVQEADMLQDVFLQAETRFRVAKRLRQKEKPEKAYGKLQDAHSYLQNSGESVLLSSMNILKAELLKIFGKLEEACRIYSQTVDILIKLGKKYYAAEAKLKYSISIRRIGDIAESNDLLLQALQLAREGNNKSVEIRCLNSMAVRSSSRGQINEAIELYREALNLAENLGFLQDYALVSSNLGVLYRIRGDIQLAENYFEKSLAVRKKLNIVSGVWSSLTDLAYIKFKKGEIREAEKLQQQVYDMRISMNAEKYEERAQRGRGIFYTKIGRLSEALTLLTQSYEKILRIGDKVGLSFVQSVLGLTYCEMGEYNKAINLFFQSMQLREALGQNKLALYSQSHLARALLQTEDIDNSMRYLMNTLSFFRKSKLLIWLAISTGKLGTYYHIRGEYEKAKEHYKEQLSILNECIDFPQKALSLYLNASLALDMGNFDDTKTFVSELSTINDKMGLDKYIALEKNIHLRLALSQDNEKNIIPALQEAEAAYDRFPGFPETQKSLATAYLETGHFFQRGGQQQKAFEMFQKAEQAVNDRPYSRRQELSQCIESFRSDTV